MKKTKHLDIIQIVAAILLFLAVGSLFYLTNSAKPIVEKEYFFPDELSSDISSPTKEIVQDAMQNYHLLMRYPSDAWFGESYLLDIEMVPNENRVTGVAQELDGQALFLEALLEMDARGVNPGNRILVPFQLYQPSKLHWEVQPGSDSLKPGKIWITIYPATEEGLQIAHDPIMVLPVSVNIHTIFGMKAGVGRWTCALIGLGCAGVILMRRHKLAKNIE
ncbi:MAG TPA: hypothetical protein DCK95_11585 [Anaerolineaceae bacterium]|uniref:Uncharacterized protein n=1 Tax=Anaerolinea thermophila TaxID=167964 RepID=A0A101FYZ0_9CHLR|nr:MAG: hypothetical protein XD73_0166 [Anaerolinea thermophila]HAF62948.1 hypothetical protein [Anaerolineaceae bacterium]